MRYRSRVETFETILGAAGSGRGMNLTKLMFSCGLSSVQVLEHSRTLIENGLLEYDLIEYSEPGHPGSNFWPCTTN